MPELPALEKSLDNPFPDLVEDFESEPKTPRKTSAPKTKPEPISKPVPRNPWGKAQVTEKNLLEGVEFLTGGLMLLPGALGEDGALLYERLPAVIHELVELGKEDRRLRLFLERIAMPGKYGPLLAASFPIVLGIAANHNLIPVALFGLGKQTETTGGE
jgi:hypothetical protein